MKLLVRKCVMKNIAAIIMAGLFITTAPVAAAPVEITGSTSVKYEVINQADAPLEPNTMYTITLKGTKNIAPGLSVYARLGAQHVNQPGFMDSDYTLSAYPPDTTTVAAIDQYGLLYKKGNLAFNLGRQAANIGTTAILYSRADTNIGINAFVEGLSINGKVGAMDIFAIAAQENSLWTPNNSLYALRGGYNLSKK